MVCLVPTKCTCTRSRDDSNPWGFSVVGNWGLDDGVGEMTDNGDGSWSITFVPETYYGLSSAEASSVTKMGIVFRSEDGSQELKDTGCSDFYRCWCIAINHD